MNEYAASVFGCDKSEAAVGIPCGYGPSWPLPLPRHETISEHAQPIGLILGSVEVLQRSGKRVHALLKSSECRRVIPENIAQVLRVLDGFLPVHRSGVRAADR